MSWCFAKHPCMLLSNLGNSSCRVSKVEWKVQAGWYALLLQSNQCKLWEALGPRSNHLAISGCNGPSVLMFCSICVGCSCLVNMSGPSFLFELGADLFLAEPVRSDLYYDI